jgi:hypothetical protein
VVRVPRPLSFPPSLFGPSKAFLPARRRGWAQRNRSDAVAASVAAADARNRTWEGRSGPQRQARKRLPRACSTQSVARAAGMNSSELRICARSELPPPCGQARSGCPELACTAVTVLLLFPASWRCLPCFLKGRKRVHGWLENACADPVGTEITRRSRRLAASRPHLVLKTRH